MTEYYYLRKAGNKLNVKKRAPGLSVCFLSDFPLPSHLGKGAIEQAKALKIADVLEIGREHLAPYDSSTLLAASGRILSTFVLEHSPFVHKFILIDGVLNRLVQPAHPTAAMVANVCEELVSLQNCLYIEMEREGLPQSSIVEIYLECGRLVMDKYWENRAGFQRTFRCENSGTGIDIWVDETTEVGSLLRSSMTTCRAVMRMVATNRSSFVVAYDVAGDDAGEAG